MDGYGPLTVRRQDSGGDTMSEERTQYTTQRYAELESQIADSAPDERTQYTTPDEVADKLLRMEAYIKQLENTNDGLAMIIGRHAETIKRLEAALHHFHAMPLDAMRRTHRYSARMVNASKAAGYTLDAWELDHGAISEWFMTLEGAA